MMTGISAVLGSALIWRSTSTPSTRGILMSRSSRTGCWLVLRPAKAPSPRTKSRASWPSLSRCRPLASPARSRLRWTRLAWPSSSSASTIRRGSVPMSCDLLEVRVERAAAPRRRPAVAARCRRARRRGLTASATKKVVPTPGDDSSQIRPPCRSTIRRTRARPMPSPWAASGVEAAEGGEHAIVIGLGDAQPVVPDAIDPQSGRQARRRRARRLRSRFYPAARDRGTATALPIRLAKTCSSAVGSPQAGGSSPTATWARLALMVSCSAATILPTVARQVNRLPLVLDPAGAGEPQAGHR